MFQKTISHTRSSFADWTQARSEARVTLLEDLRDHHDWRAKVQWLARTSEEYKDVDKKQIEITGAQRRTN